MTGGRTEAAARFLRHALACGSFDTPVLAIDTMGRVSNKGEQQ
jgi:hypothetical protein